MSRFSIVIVCATVVFISYLMTGCDAHRIHYDDLEVAASDKHDQWEKGEDSDHHDSGFGDSGKKGEKGYDKKHGCVLNSNRLIYLNCFISSATRLLKDENVQINTSLRHCGNESPSQAA